MKQITYHPIQSKSQPISGFQMKESGVAKGECWPLLQNGKHAAVIQLDEMLVCLSVEEKDDYYTAEQQINKLVEDYLSSDAYRVKRLLAAGKVMFYKRPCDVVVNVGGETLLTISTIPFQTNLCLVDSNDGNAFQYYVDFIHPYLYDPMFKRENYAPLMVALQPAKQALGMKFL